MIKFPGSNLMHIEPNKALIEDYKQAWREYWIQEKVRGNLRAEDMHNNATESLCGICYTRNISAVFLPCQHCECCAVCAFRSTKFNGLCPFCRTVRKFVFFEILYFGDFVKN